MNKRLIELAQNTDKFFAHQYIEVYEAFFEPIRDSVKNVLEVGINTGNSHRMWRDYFHNANIYGVDICDFCGGMADEERIDVRFMDAYSDDAIKSFGDMKFDVVIDDGPHTLASQQFFVSEYSRLMSDKGILVIEDIPFAEWIPDIAVFVPDGLRMNSFSVDRRWVPNRDSINDELMFFIDKRFVS